MKRAGFSLVEVMVAILILGVGLVGLTQGITTALGSSKDAEVQSAAVFLAAGQLETLRAEGYVIEGETEGEAEGSLSGYTWVQNITETKPEGLYEVTVTVQNGNGEEIYELKTLLFDPPIVREDTESERNERNERDRRREP